MLFGSFARRDGDSDSDVDILIVRPASVHEDDRTWADQRHELARRVESWTGNRAQVIDLSDAELAEAVAAGEPLIASLGSARPAGRRRPRAAR